MEFNRSEEHQLLASSLNRFLAGSNPVETRNDAAFTAPFFNPSLWSGLADLGVMGAFFSESHGGFGGSADEVLVIFEEIGLNLCAEPLLGQLMGAHMLKHFDCPNLVAQAISGEARLALAVFEPEAIVSLEYLAARAESKDGIWRLWGRKSAIYGGPSATHVLVAVPLAHEIGLFLVEAPHLIGTAMMDGGGIADMVMHGLEAQCLSQTARAALEEALDLGRLALCAEAVGTARHLINLTVDYLGQRKQFGRPLSSFQALQHRAVNMLVELEQLRSITMCAAAHFNGPVRARYVAMAKSLTGRFGSHIAEEAIQLHGGIGMTWEYPGAHYAKRLVMIDHQLGDRHDHIERMIAGKCPFPTAR